MKAIIEKAIREASYENSNGEIKSCSNGAEAKQALIRSSMHVKPIHDLLSNAIREVALREGFSPHGIQTYQELTIPGFFKSKKQDVVATFEQMPKNIENLLLSGKKNEYIYNLFLNKESTKHTKEELVKAEEIFSEHSLIINIRGQLSSINKNFDTLMERTAFEAFNLRMKYKRIKLGEVYFIPIKEYDSNAAKENEVRFKDTEIDISAFLRFFSLIHNTSKEVKLYGYDLVLLLIVDFTNDKAKLLTAKDLGFTNYYIDIITSPVFFIEKLTSTIRSFKSSNKR